jgi:DNA polymerase gamma 1
VGESQRSFSATAHDKASPKRSLSGTLLGTTASPGTKNADTDLNPVPASPRFNEIGVQQLSDYVHPQVFPNQSRVPDPELVALSRDHLARHDLLGKSQKGAEPVAFDLPELQGKTLDEHFYKLGMDAR